jgi:hypothetical protein
MIVIFQADARQRAHLIQACDQAGMDHEVDDLLETLACYFDDVTDFMAWHRSFVRCFGWAPLDYEVVMDESEEHG